MKFYIQMGHGMKSISTDLSALWQGATVILSPLNMPENQLASFSQMLRKTRGSVLLDPQMYSPRKYHKNLEKYSYWPNDSLTNIELGECEGVLNSLNRINEEIQSDAFILPSNTTNRIDDLWGRVQTSILNHAKCIAGNKSMIHTIALSKDVLYDQDQVQKAIQLASQWEVDGVYIVCEHPESYYLVDKPLWVTNLLELVAGIKRQGKRVIVGYASHQMLCLALAKCDAIAAGNFLNVRWFQPEHFITKTDNEPSRRSIWYYCPQAFSEYKVTYLDVAKRANLLDRMAPPPDMANEYSRVLFEGAMPSSTGYKEGHSHRHYLHCLNIQCKQATKPTYKETRDAHLALLGTALHLTTGLRNEKIKGQDRDFSEIIDVIEAAISVFDKDYGFSLSREWDTL